MRPGERFSLEGKTAIVTGGAGLLGREHCRALADSGCRVVVTDLDQQSCERVANELGRSALGVAADVCDSRSVRALAEETIDRCGRIDILVNNAAINDKFESPGELESSRFENYPLEQWNRSLTANVTGPFLCCQILGGEMVRAGGGSIVNVASTYALVAPDQSLYRDADGDQRFYKSPIYPTSKAAVLGLTRFLAAYWGQAGVRVNALSPGGVKNGQEEFFVREYGRRTPMGRMATPMDFMGALIFLASDASAYVTGANLVIDGGYTIW